VTPSKSTTEIRERLGPLLAEPVESLGLDLEGVDVETAGKHRVVRVAVDRDGGVDMDHIADATRAVSAVLDETDVMGERPYTLEVSSPGVDRPLTLPRHWRRNIGRLVTVTFHEGDPVTGRITASDETSAELDVDGERREIALADVARAKVQIEFRRLED
jgi:ribosome maturation factor RimP